MIKLLTVSIVPSFAVGCFGATGYEPDDNAALSIEIEGNRLYDSDKEITDFSKLEFDREYEDYTYYLSGADVFSEKSIFFKGKQKDVEYLESLEKKYPDIDDTIAMAHEVALFYGFQIGRTLTNYENIDSGYDPDQDDFDRRDEFRRASKLRGSLYTAYRYNSDFMLGSGDEENSANLTYEIIFTSEMT